MTDAMNSPDPAPLLPWDKALTRRLRVLLHSTPFSDLKKSEALIDPELRHYDPLALSMKVLDLIVDRMGLEREVTSDDVAEALRPLLTSLDEARGIPPDHGRHARITGHVLGRLRNDAERRHPFAVEYVDFSGGRPVRRSLEFRLILDHFDADGRVVLRLSNEGANLFLNALELDIEDAQAATEAVVQSQLARGKFNEAVDSAKAARAQSVRYFEKIMGLLRDTRRNLAGIDWRREVPGMLDSALAHIKMRLETERNILSNARDRQEALSENDPALPQIAEIIGLIDDCKGRHAGLHKQVMRARNVFLEEQERQTFAPPVSRFYPDLLKEILEPLLALDQRMADSVASGAFPAFWGGVPPQVFSLARLVAWQLQPKREISIGETPFEAPEIDDLSPDLRRYSPDDRRRAFEILESIGAPTPLSTLIGGGAERRGVIEILALLSLERFSPEGPAKLSVSRRGLLDARGLYGDDLLLTPQETVP